jgi:hypothetical protein
MQLHSVTKAILIGHIANFTVFYRIWLFGAFISTIQSFLEQKTIGTPAPRNLKSGHMNGELER